MPSYDQTRYWTTHNSYEGGPRGSIPAQLDRNVRCLELDVWDNDYDKVGDFRVGHFKPGHAVALGTVAPGNPNTLRLRDWLETIADWSAQHANHGVITLVLDLKSDLTDNAGAGDLEDLNAELEDVFGARLFTRDDYDVPKAWPETTALRNRVLCVLSGNGSNRAAYRYCFGAQPALAVNARGDVALAYRSEAGDMRCWTGKARLPSGARPGALSWRHKGTYAWNAFSVSEPSLAMTDDGWIVSVHRVGPAPGTSSPALLECVVGELHDDGRMTWGGASGVGSGMLPSLALTSDNRLLLTNTTESGKSLRVRKGTLDRKKHRVDWAKAEAAGADAPPTRDTALWKGHALRCLVNARRTILAAFDGAQRAVGYRQLAFVELQSEEADRDLLDPLFYGASASNTGAIAAARARGQVARAWWFKQGDAILPPKPENFAATDHPFDAFYAAYVTAGGPTEV